MGDLKRLCSRSRALFVALVALVALTSLALAPARARADEPGKLVIWHAYRGAEQEALDRVIDRFRAAHPGAEVRVLAVPFDAYASKLEAAIVHNQGPDVFFDAHERLGSFREKGLVGAIDDDLLRDRGAFDPAALRTLTLDGKVWALPVARKCLALYLRAPSWPAGKGPRTMDELVALARAKHAPTLAYEASNAYAHAPLLHGVGGRMMDTDGGRDRYAFADGPARDSLAWILAAIDARAVPEEASGALVTQMFTTGSGAASLGADAAISGPWLAAELPAGLAYHVAPIPPVHAGSGPTRPFLTVEGAMRAPTLRDPALAKAFLGFVVSTESAVVRAKVGRQVVATMAAWQDPSIRDDPFLAGFRRAADDAIPMPTTPGMRAAWEPTTRAIQKVLRRDMSPADAIVEAAHRFADVTRPPPSPRDPRLIQLVLGAIALLGAFQLVRVARDPARRREVRESLPAYAYLLHAVVIVALLVVVPLVLGAATSFFAGRGQELHYVGVANYVEILTARGGPLLASGSFYAVLAVTVLWTLANVTLHLVIGMALALLLSRPMLKLRGVYRVLLVVPWAVPSYVSALAWKGMFHRQLGAVNALLGHLGVEPVAWFSKFSTAFAANVATNVWLGFPFMMVVTLGALTSIPREVLEAAEVDGATRWQRFSRITFPLLRPTLAPSVVLGAVWTFNMFNVVFLVSGGEPDGRTEILVSEAYRWAFTRQAQYGYASAYAVLIFLLLLVTTRGLKRKEVTR